jgi:hypothetical protein
VLVTGGYGTTRQTPGVPGRSLVGKVRIAVDARAGPRRPYNTPMSSGSPLRFLIYGAVGVGVLLVGAFIGVVPYNHQLALGILLAIVVGATYWVPRAAAKDPDISTFWLGSALAVKIVGALTRYVMLQVVFGGGDAVAYHEMGVDHYQMARELDFSFVEPPYFGTVFVEDATAFLYAVTGPTMLGAFLIFSLLAFIGTWLFYRAARLSFPGGDGRLYFFLLFFLPTMAFWPSSLGKDALVVFGLGVATWGLAKLLKGISVGSALQMTAGVAVTFGVRPAVGVMFAAGAAVAFLFHPGKLRSPLSRPLSWVFLGPIMAAVLVVATAQALEYEQLEADVTSVVEEYVATRERLVGEGGSVIEGPLPTSPGGFGQAVLTVLFRPFPWELADPLAAAAGLESLFILAIFLLRLKPGWRALRNGWRGGMVVCALIMVIALIAPLTAAANFGLLVRQRAQLLPFLFLILTAVPRPGLRRGPSASPYLRDQAPSQLAATSG